jgi:ADP-ribose pyrophosphatase
MPDGMTGRVHGRTLRSQRLYAGRVLALDLDEVEEPEGVRAVREVVRHQGSVAVLPVHDDGRVVLVRQYRYPVDDYVWELPAGRLDAGEAPAEGARRELEEEVGLRPSGLELLTTVYPTPGFCDERLHVFRATGLQPVPARPEADERIEAATFRLEEARAMIGRGEVRDAKTLVALLLERERQQEAAWPR